MQNTIQFDMADIVSRQAKAFSQQDTMDCSCHRHCVTTALPCEPQVTMAYVPFQLDKTSYQPEKALMEGTLFTTLNKPFCGRSLANE